MGVRHLESFIETCVPEAIERVDLAQLVRTYRESKGHAPEIVMDGYNVLRFIFKTDWLNGGQVKQFRQAAEKFLHSFTSIGCKLVVYFDGPTQPKKLETWKERQNERAKTFSRCLSAVEAGLSASFLEGKCTSSFMSGCLCATLFTVAATTENCKVMCSLIEADEEIAVYAHENNCFGIMARDSDYLIFGAGDHYFCIKYFELDTMTVGVYNRDKIASAVGLSLDKWPLWASLTGNCFFPPEKSRQFLGPMERTSWEEYVRAVMMKTAETAKGIQLDCDYSSVCQDLYGSDEYSKLLKGSVDGYNLQLLSKNKGFDLLEFFTEDESWNEIIRLAVKRHLEPLICNSLVTIMLLNTLNIGSSLEDYQINSRIDYPLCAKVLARLRKCIYGVLLDERPTRNTEQDYVTEVVLTSFDTFDEAKVSPKYLTQAPHPGLKILWSDDESVEDTRWAIAQEVFGIDVKDALTKLPPRLLLPLLALKYLHDEEVKVRDWEFDAVMCCNVCVESYPAEALSSLPSDPLSSRSIWLYNLVNHTYHYTLNLFYCLGLDILKHKMMSYEFTDGKLFHKKFRQAEKNAFLSTLCEEKEENIEMVKTMRKLALCERGCEKCTSPRQPEPVRLVTEHCWWKKQTSTFAPAFKPLPLKPQPVRTNWRERDPCALPPDLLLPVTTPVYKVPVKLTAPRPPRAPKEPPMSWRKEMVPVSALHSKI